VHGRFVGDRYHLVRELGRGGMGVVYLGRDLRLDMDVAIKFRGVTHSDATLWLKREFRTISSLRHPNLVELYELVVHDRTCYFTMEYLPGVDPRRWVEVDAPSSPAIAPPGSDSQSTRSALPLQEAHAEASLGSVVEVASPFARVAPNVAFSRVRAVLAQLAEGLAFLHACGVIHRDVKPSNVIVLDGTVKLLDFGLALEQRRQAEDLAREHRVVGTAAYLAPEYLAELRVSPAMDVFALGVVAYELVTGAPPFGGSLHVLARTGQPITVPRPSTLNASVPPDLDELIMRMLAQDPARRPSAFRVASELTGALSQPRVPRRMPRFVGRARELAELAAQIADPAPRARLVLVTGGSGAGKSALIDEAVGRARVADTWIWRGRCDERERVPYRAVDLIIDDIATELAGDPRLAREVEHAAALARVFPVLAPWIDPTLAEPSAADLRVERERALIAMTQLFRHLLGTRRGVIVIDDLQWADDDSLELLAMLVERAERPLTIVASCTTDGANPRLAGLRERLAARAHAIDLPAMPPGELAQLIADLAPGAPATRLATAAALAQGSPYLAELIGRELAEADVVDLDDAERRRLARLAPGERDVAQLAALAGGAATFEQLRAIAELPSSRLQSALRGLEHARIVRAMPSASGDPVYVFYHQRLREAAYAEVPPSVRRARHERYARWHESTGGEPGQLAYHWERAGDHARAARCAIAAAEAARAQLAWSIAADWYDRALALGHPDPIAARAGRAEMRLLGGKLADAAEDFLVIARDTSGARSPIDRDRWRIRAAEAYLKLGEIERGLGILDGVLERRGEARARDRTSALARAAVVAARWLAPLPARRQPVDEVLASAYRVLASFLSTPYPLEALEYVLRGIALAERTGDRAAHGQGLAMLATYLATGSLGLLGDRVLATAQRLVAYDDAPYPRMVTAGAAGILATLRGDWTRMRAAHAEAERVCQRLGLQRSWEASFLRSYWALGEYYAGEPARALAMLDELAASADDLFSRAMLGSTRGRALVLEGDLAAAHEVARELARSPAARRGVASIYRQVFTAELALAEHAWDRALGHATALAADVRAQWLSTLPAISAMIDVITATAELGRGDRASARRARRTARRLYRRGRRSFYAATALRLWAQAEGQLGDAAAARAILARAARVAADRGGRVDQLAIAALEAGAIQPGELAAAVAWSTGGLLQGAA